MQRLVRWGMIVSVVFVGACSNGTRKGWDTNGAGATAGISGGRPGVAATSSAAGSVAPTMAAPDSSKKSKKKP